jgi:hypothetical protein
MRGSLRRTVCFAWHPLERIATTRAMPVLTGLWLPWLEAEFGWSEDTATSAEFATNRNLQDLEIDVSAL